MTTEEQTEESSGKEFRQKFEALQAENRALRSAAAEAIASRFQYVKSEDLMELAPDQVTTKAQEIEEARKADAEALVKKFLADRGVAGDDLDTALQKLAQKQEAPADGGSAARLAALGQLGGQPISKRDPTEGLFGIDRVRAAL